MRGRRSLKKTSVWQKNVSGGKGGGGGGRSPDKGLSFKQPLAQAYLSMLLTTE